MTEYMKSNLFNKKNIEKILYSNHNDNDNDNRIWKLD